MRFPFRRRADTPDAKALTGSPAIVEALADRRLQPYRSLGGSNIDTRRIGSVFVQHQSASYAWLYTHQPAVRSTVDYIARNAAQLSCKVYDRISDDEREHVGDHPAAKLLRNPNPWTPGQQFIFTLFADFMVYNNAYVLKLKPGSNGQRVLMNIPPSAIGILGSQRYVVEAYRIYKSDGTYEDVPADAMLHWRGYDPDNPRMGVSILETLREELAADAAARTAKTELDKAGGLPKGWIERPIEAPVLSPEAAERVLAGLSNWTANPKRGLPLFEEGMQFKQAELSPAEQQMLESRQFTKGEVHEAFGVGSIPPKDEEERQQFYADVLRPMCEMVCSYFDLSILYGEYGEDSFYSEFNLDEKFMGDNRLKAMTSAAGVPPLTRNEARARLNEPPVEGGDVPITPLNVFAGDPTKVPKPSTDVMPIQDPNKPSQDGDHRDDPKALDWKNHLQEDLEAKAIAYNKAHPPIAGPELKALPPGFEISVPRWEDRYKEDFSRQARYVDEAIGKVQRMYSRQAAVLRHKSGGKMDFERWDREHAEDLFALLTSIVDREGGRYAARLAGIDFDMAFVQNYLKAQSEAAAEAMNAVTQEAIVAVGLEAAFDEIEEERGDRFAVSMAVRAVRFARQTAAERFAPNPERRLKIWIRDTDRHLKYHGVAVPLNEDWGGIEPGSLPNCRCSMTIQ